MTRPKSDDNELVYEYRPLTSSVSRQHSRGFDWSGWNGSQDASVRLSLPNAAITCCRAAPTLSYEACRDMLDCMADDQANTVILWIGGGFRSKKFPVTWQYNADHANVRHDYLGRLIRHAHRRGVKCLLGFTPFGYDGVNQYPREHRTESHRAGWKAGRRVRHSLLGLESLPGQSGIAAVHDPVRR